MNELRKAAEEVLAKSDVKGEVLAKALKDDPRKCALCNDTGWMDLQHPSKLSGISMCKVACPRKCEQSKLPAGVWFVSTPPSRTYRDPTWDMYGNQANPFDVRKVQWRAADGRRHVRMVHVDDLRALGIELEAQKATLICVSRMRWVDDAVAMPEGEPKLDVLQERLGRLLEDYVASFCASSQASIVDADVAVARTTKNYEAVIDLYKQEHPNWVHANVSEFGVRVVAYAHARYNSTVFTDRFDLNLLRKGVVDFFNTKV